MTIAPDLSDLAPTGERPAADTSSALMSRGCGPRAQTALAVHVGSFGDSHPVVGGLMKKEPKEIGEFELTLHPRDYRVFAGVIDLDHWPA